MSASTLTSKGQTTIPRQIRDHLKLQPGDKIDFIIEDDKVIIEPATLDVKDIEGMLFNPKRKTVSVEAMKTAVKKRFRGKRY